MKPLWISELSTIESRGSLGVLWAVFNQVGKIFASFLGHVLQTEYTAPESEGGIHSDSPWRIGSAVSGGLAIVMIVIISWWPESPMWLSGRTRDGDDGGEEGDKETKGLLSKDRSCLTPLITSCPAQICYLCESGFRRPFLVTASLVLLL